MSISEPSPVLDGALNPAEGLEVLPFFPPELEREIFLLTARTYRGVPTRLMLVVSRAKTWRVDLSTPLRSGFYHVSQVRVCRIQNRAFCVQDGHLA